MTSDPTRWLEDFRKSAPARALAGALSAGRCTASTGVRGSAGTLFAGAVALELEGVVLLVTAHLDEADEAMGDLENFAGLTAERFGALEVLPGESGVDLELVAERLALVQRITSGALQGPAVVVAPVQALMQPVPPPDELDQLVLNLRAGEQINPARLLDWLERAGYVRQDAVDQPGDFATRGGLIDLHPMAGHAVDEAGLEGPISPVRLDFFGDEIESIHRVDPETMGSGPPLGRISIIGKPAQDVQHSDAAPGLLDLLDATVLPMLHETLELNEQARGYFERLTNATGITPPGKVFAGLTGRPHAELNGYSQSSNPEARTVELAIEPLASFSQDAKQAIAELGALAAEPDQRVTVVCAKAAERERLIELLVEFAPEQHRKIGVVIGQLHRGFAWRDRAEKQEIARCLVPHHELFHRYETRRRVRRVMSPASGDRAADAFLDLDVGDYVVHVEHGIAKFIGLKTMRGKKGADGQPTGGGEYLTLQFAQQALLHVPVAQIDLIQRYVGGFEGRPPLSALGGRRWKRQKDQVADAVKDLASELLRVQAARETQPGVRYPDDTAWQREFEAEFPYDETEDQTAAIAAIKQDMARDMPMDRLICGDVGFGKTEVAIRAAFKAAEFGKQVAVLVPTTVLAEQHERTFRGRFADYPFSVESLSRFRTAKEQREILDRVKAGQVDVLIGTHRILSKDVTFADLGLVIIDEEQRFGVEHKSRLLAFRLTADVLTLTATPIPRTLHMSMVGLRDISSLTTAPVDRRAIVTEVAPYSEERIRQALIRELSREGQVYFVHNRVHNIQSVADDLQQLVPDARILVGHGQMAARELERIMLAFMRREADVLVSTTIIESGIDIPSANTMFINQADHFGLADLHQLRGRVGRYKHRAYCYMLLPPERTVTEVAAKRLKAIESYSMLGAGFKIAMRDLEIRGAGNLLGAEQSGHIAAVGYEMYCLLLEQETKRLRREPIIEASKTHLELPITGSLPKRYVPSEKHRMAAYRRLTRVDNLDQLDDVVKDLTDAYGKPPAAARTFIDLMEIRVAASIHRIDRIKLETPDLIVTTARPGQVAPRFEDAPGRASIIDERTIYYRPPVNYLDNPATILAVLRKLLVRPLREPVHS